ncbi:MAG: hypothetical protein V7K86_28785 [Nostoc sp.]|uniref:hypothetical protein n=1 Tax=Nostoc sp. TaxID=1180 RepID=UPI002FF5B2B1
MPFKKNHKLGFIAKGTEALDRKPLTIKVHLGIRERVMDIPDWQSKLRTVIEVWLSKVDVDDQV